MSAAVDVLVVGAGPAGAAAGLAAQRRGLDVLVVDKAGFPRDKTCGDGLTTAALRLIEQLGVDLRQLPGYMAVR
ncbi:MAG: NAD(P)/FAD-dependent oxidoreductase, partial [Acidimicrobiia bacterium]